MGRWPHALLTLLLLAASPVSCPCWAASPGNPTSLLRELAKNPQRILIITSGPIATPLAEDLQASVLRQPDNKHKREDVRVVPFDLAEEAERASVGPKKPGAFLIFVLATQETAQVTKVPLDAAMPVRLRDLGKTDSVAACQLGDVAKKGVNGLVVAAVAPDAKRLAKMLDVVTARTASDWRMLPFQEKWTTNRVAVFSRPDLRTAAIGKWGAIGAARVWDEVLWYPIGDRPKLTAEQLDECTEAYFVDSRDREMLPGAAAKLLEGAATTDTVVGQGKSDSGNPFALFAAFAPGILAKKLERYPVLTGVPGREVNKVIDLRRPVVARTGLRVYEVDSERPFGRARVPVAHDMRQEPYNLDVEEGSDSLAQLGILVAEKDILGSTETRMMIREKSGFRHVWLLRVTARKESTAYTPVMDKVTPYPGEYRAPEPQRPDKGRKESDYDYSLRLRQWEREYDVWLRAKQAFERERDYITPVQWSWRIDVREHAGVDCYLGLYDLLAPDRAVIVLLDAKCAGEADGQASIYKEGSVSVRGHLARPDTPECPPNTASCADDLVMNAVHNASTAALEWVRENCVLPSDQVVDPPPATLAVPSAEGLPGLDVSLRATLTVPGEPKLQARRPVKFTVGQTDLGTAETDAAGVAAITYSIPTTAQPGAIAVTVSFSGDAQVQPASATGNLTVQSLGQTTIPPPPPVPPIVADVTGSTITVALGSQSAPKVGGSGYILVDKVIYKPGTKEILEVLKVAIAKIRVVRLSSVTVGCTVVIPPGAKPEDFMAKIKIGMPVKWEVAQTGGK